MSRFIAPLIGFALLNLTVLPVSGQDAAAPPGVSTPEHPVMVIKAETELKQQSEVVGKVGLAQILVGREVNGSWLWIPSGNGWIRQSDVVPLDKAIEHFTSQIEQNPSSQSYYERGAANVSLGQDQQAIADFSKAIELDPENLPALNDRGTSYRRLGQSPQAKADFDRMIAKGVKHPAAYTNRGLTWLDLGNTEQAMVDLHAALELDPKFAPAWEASGAAREAMGHLPKAIEDYRKAVEIDPNFAMAWNNAAWLLATAPDASVRNGAQAVEYATKACELTSFQKADFLDTLAAAHAEAGQFTQAVARARETLQLVDEKHKATIEERLKLYEAGRPFHELGEPAPAPAKSSQNP